MAIYGWHLRWDIDGMYFIVRHDAEGTWKWTAFTAAGAFIPEGQKEGYKTAHRAQLGAQEWYYRDLSKEIRADIEEEARKGLLEV